MKKKSWKTKALGILIFLGLFARLMNRLKPVKMPTFDKNVVATVAKAPTVFSSIHYGERTLPIRHIVVHSFALPVPEMVKRLNDLGLSTHYLIDTHGKVTRLVPEDKVAWHAGASYWRGMTNLNATSIGIELENNTLGQTPFTEEQLSAFQLLVKDLIYRYRIDTRNIVAHSDIAPTRKADVGQAFPWQEMASHGIGLWPGPGKVEITSTDMGELLSQIGYDISDLDRALLAFERRFMPEIIAPDLNLDRLEENLHLHSPVKNSAVLERLNAVARLYRAYQP